MCPPPIARVYEERLPDATLHLTDDTHQILFTRWRELLADVSRSRHVRGLTPETAQSKLRG